jgi:hypothetical protein
MNSPELINPHALPRLSLVNRKSLPEISAIYFVIDQQCTVPDLIREVIDLYLAKEQTTKAR